CARRRTETAYKAEGVEASWHMTAKPTGSTPTVNAALVHRQFALKVNVAKSQVAPMSECAFLGFTIKGKKIRWTDKALADFKHRIKELTGRSWGVSMEYRLKKLGQYLRGWTAYFGISQYYRPVPELDEWIRRRMRMCYWKQWRWPRTKIKNLLALG
ncbi:MAG: group II intron maturase-specific domain-containing protein, partial [Hydrogenophaga sp.]|nr:group II intron maturase-specific domain-containing protein [Hydrogenophaga sp.]